MTTTKSFEACQRPNSWAAATASAAIVELAPSGLEQFIRDVDVFVVVVG
jgi:hypothetical protein